VKVFSFELLPIIPHCHNLVIPEELHKRNALKIDNRRMGIDSFIGTVYSGVIKSFETRGR